MAIEWKTNPGSREAINEGCTCPVLDNGHGAGYLGDGAKFGWVVSAGCPLHAKPSAPVRIQEPPEEGK